MSDVLIIGGGFAGVWGAMAAARVRVQNDADLRITLVTPGDDLVIRPRLYEADPSTLRVALERVLQPIGVGRLPGIATAVDTEQGVVSVTRGDGRIEQLGYRRLILASGSALRSPEVPGREHLFDVDTLSHAVALDTHVRALPARPVRPGRLTAVIIGAGFTGLEVATEMVTRLRTVAGSDAHEVRVVLVERADMLGPELGPGPHAVIKKAVEELGIEVHLNAGVAALDAGHVVLTDGTEIPAHTAVWTAGMSASQLTRQIASRRDRLGRLHVDPYLRVPESPEVFAAGDTAAALADAAHMTVQSCQHAIPLGRYAGHNAAADLLGRPLMEFSPADYVTCLDLGEAGAVLTTGWERSVKLTGGKAKDLKRTIVEDRIYPPLDDPAALLNAGDPEAPWS
ncbi:dehydrogenase [Actinomadura spongiicola]|uniref:Dehydrogenase n=1 Tax=Actinomadura spongiicola TaxID=2303421 RepID=A0A372GGF4_9ACTN|nr:dehydrogenase [Actinomadura spongiicola]